MQLPDDSMPLYSLTATGAACCSEGQRQAIVACHLFVYDLASRQGPELCWCGLGVQLPPFWHSIFLHGHSPLAQHMVLMSSHALVTCCMSVKLYYTLAVPAVVPQGWHPSCARSLLALSDMKEVRRIACLRQVV